MFRSSRERQSEGAQRWVYPKIFLFVIGAALGLAGMTAGIDWLVTVAIAVLAAGVLLRFIAR